jgi:hypothetical protein
MSKNKKQPHHPKLAIKGSFLDVFKVIKKDKDRRAKESTKPNQ